MDRQIAPAPSQSPGRHQHSNMDRCRTCPYIVPEFVGGPQTHILALRLEVVEDGLHLAARVELQTKDTPAGGQVPCACPRRSTRYAGACSWWDPPSLWRLRTGDTRRAGNHEGRLCEPTLNSAPAAAPAGPVWDPAHERHLVPYQQPYSLPVHQTVILVHCCSTDMLKARPLSDLLSHTLDPSIESAMYGTSVSERRRTSDEDSSQLTAHSLFTKTGSLLAQASNPSDQRRSRVIAALAASIWSSSDSIDSAEDEVDATKGSDYICVPLEVRSSVRLSLRGHSRVETT